eukprot:gene43410-53907_t
MLSYILKRILLMVPTLLGVLLLTFVVIQFVPGGPVEQLVSQLQGRSSGGEGAAPSSGAGDYRGRQGLSPKQIQEIKELYGFDKPAHERFVKMLWSFARFDLGQSFYQRKAVSDLVREKLPVSISLATSGRDLGYIIPVDSDPQQFATDAIPMSELQNIAESVTAKHTLFVMDACYSGLGLTRGGGNGNFLRDNAKRVGRQMLTAGGADQLVADGGPNGHSVFTWALLQGLGGKGDLNGDGIITATELAAYVAPAVASASSQTPAFGSLPGSEGGDFVFELPTETEFLSAQSTQLGSEAIAMNTKLDAGKPAAVPAPQSAASGAPSAAGPAPKVVHRFFHVPASNTAVGHLILENQPA